MLREQLQRTTSMPVHEAVEPGSAAAHQGVYCLRTNVVDWDDATLWRT